MAIAIKPRTAAINLGYYQIKANDEICFKSRAELTSDNHNITGGDMLELEGNKYVLEVGNPLLEGDKTVSPLTKV